MEFQKVNKSAGRISPTPMGDYDDTTTYRRLDWVYYGGTSYICKKNNTLGIKPSNPERWQKIIDEIGDMKIVFTEAGERKLFTSGENLSVIIGKIKKFISDLKTVAFTGKYSDLTGQPQSLKNPQALNIKYNGTTQVNYDGSEVKEINITPANIGAPATSAVLTTTEQITANTSTGNIAGALAAKAMMADYNNKINQINSNMVYKAGETIGRAGTMMWIYGTMTGGRTQIFTFIPINKPIDGNITFNLFRITVRQNDEYLCNLSNVDEINNLIFAEHTIFPNFGLYLKLTKSGGWGGINNSIVSLAIAFTITIS